MKNHFGCPVQATSNVFAGKWKVLIVWHLGFGSRRFAEIRDLLPGVSEKVLAAQLRELEHDDFSGNGSAPCRLHAYRCGQRTDLCDGSDVRMGNEISGRRAHPAANPTGSDANTDTSTVAH